jgi:hypothetical protein
MRSKMAITAVFANVTNHIVASRPDGGAPIVHDYNYEGPGPCRYTH